MKNVMKMMQESDGENPALLAQEFQKEIIDRIWSTVPCKWARFEIDFASDHLFAFFLTSRNGNSLVLRKGESASIVNDKGDISDATELQML